MTWKASHLIHSASGVCTDDEAIISLYADTMDPVFLPPDSPFRSPVIQQQQLPSSFPSSSLAQTSTSPLFPPPSPPTTLLPLKSPSHKSAPNLKLARNMSLRSLSSLRPHKFVRTGEQRLSLRQPSSRHRRTSLRHSFNNPYPDTPPRLRRFSVYSSISMTSLVDVRVGEQQAEEEKGQVSTKMNTTMHIGHTFVYSGDKIDFCC